MSRTRRMGARMRAGLWATLAGVSGVGLYYFDDWCESIQSPALHDVTDAFEMLVMGPGLALLGYLISMTLSRRDERLRAAVESERERRFAFLGRIAASVAHEIRNPLHNAHLLHEELAAQLDAIDRDLSARLRQNLRRVDHATALIYELARQPTRLTDGEGADLDAELRQAIADVRSELGEAATIEAEGEAPRPIRCRAASTFIILRNLLRNACQAGGSAPVRVVVAPTADGHVEVRIRNQGRFTPSLTDDGDAGEPTSAGLGIGLGLTRHLLTLAEGTLTFSPDGDGVLACVCWPLMTGVDPRAA